MAERLQLIEPVPIDDDFCTALATVEDLGFGARLVFYADHTAFETGDAIHVVKRKIVIPRAGVVLGNRLVRAYLAQPPGPLKVVK